MMLVPNYSVLNSRAFLISCSGFVFFLFSGTDLLFAESPSSANFVGRSKCVECHEKEDKLWQGSDHDRAMDEANESTVNGDFNKASFSYHGVRSTFFKKDGKYFVRTDGSDGTLQEFQIKYVFGHYPLEQYLIEFPGGRLQALNVCWDSRSKKEGGQRWFHLYPDEKIDHTHPFHWTGAYQNWNHMCAECHSTNLQKNYDLETDTYKTSWSEIDVSCEACHGPGSAHIEWAKAVERGEKTKDSKPNGMVLSLKDGGPGEWVFDPETGTAKRSTPLTSRKELETCARCHSRRGVVRKDYIYDKSLLDTHRPRLLDEHLYYADGQIQDEVYVWASFLQSKMYQAGVTCSHCHDPHSGKRYAEGNVLCYRCHLPHKFDTPEHHFHKPDSTGAKCIECHAPQTKYMVVDPRADHSFRIPRPDLSEALGNLDACSKCHSDKSLEWNIEAFEKWYGKEAMSKPHYGEVIKAGRLGAPEALQGLIRLSRDETQPEIVRATALRLLGSYRTRESAETIGEAIKNPSPMIRYGALSSLQMFPPKLRFKVAKDLLRDPVAAVRVEAAGLLAGVPLEGFTSQELEVLDIAASEYELTEMIDADRASAHVRLGVFHSVRGDVERAIKDYKTALRVEPSSGIAYTNLADIYRESGKDDLAEEVLRKGLRKAGHSAEVHHSFGLLLVRKTKIREALQHLEKAAELVPENPHFTYVYAVALNSSGEGKQAREVLRKSLSQHPYDEETIFMLATICRDNGEIKQAIEYVKKLIAISPQNRNYQMFLRQLEGGKLMAPRE